MQEALSAPQSLSGEDILSIVILVVSGLSALGAGWMILSFALIPSLRSFRHQLILGLGISDFIMALNFMLSTCMNLSGRKIWSESSKGFCSFNGFMTQVFVTQTDYWVLGVAICTYTVLAGHKSAFEWMRGHSYIICILPWVFSITWAVLGLELVGYYNIGAWCWFASDRTRLLVNFIPRWVIVFIIIVLYSRLSYLLFRFQRQMESTTADDDTTIILSGLPKVSSSRTSADPSLVNNSQKFGSGIATTTATATAGSRSTLHPRLKKISVRMMMYPVIYMLIWTIPTAIRIYQGTTGRSVSLAVNCIDKSCIAIQGLADSIIYGLNERTWNEWAKLIFPRRASSRID